MFLFNLSIFKSKNKKTKKVKKIFYIDTSIWIDLYENRVGFNQEPIGDYALKLFSKISKDKDILIIAQILIEELEVRYSLEQITGMLAPFRKIIEKVTVTKSQIKDAKEIVKLRKLPFGDVLHAIVARDNTAILVTRDKHFKQLTDISKHYKPEELI